jgi:HEAT repeat protein
LRECKKFDYCYPEPLLHVLQQADVRFHTPQIQHQLQHIERQGLSVPSDILESLRRGRSLHAAVLDALAAIGDPRALPVLLSLVDHEDQDIRSGVAAALGAIGAPAIDPLLHVLTSAKPRVRACTAMALGFVKDQRAAAALSEVARHDPDTAVRAVAIESLGFQEEEGVTEVLVRGLEDSEVRVQLASLNALLNLALLGRADPAIRPAVQRLAERHVVPEQFGLVLQEQIVRVLRQLE